MKLSTVGVRATASSSRQHSRSGSSSSSDSSRSAARRAAVPSSTPRSSIASSMSVRVNSRTTKPPPGSVSRRPSCSSVMRAMRSGVRETPSSSTRRSSGTRSRGLKTPFEQELAEPERRLRRLRVRVVAARHDRRVTACRRFCVQSGPRWRCQLGDRRRLGSRVRRRARLDRAPAPRASDPATEGDEGLDHAVSEAEEDRDHEDAVEDLPQLEARRQPARRGSRTRPRRSPGRAACRGRRTPRARGRARPRGRSCTSPG